MSFLQNPYRFESGTPPSIFTGAVGIFSLINRFSWTDGIIKLRRSSDNATKYVWFDGDTITTSSVVGDDVETPSATTLGTWIGSDDGFIEEWYMQVETGLAPTTPHYLVQTTTSLQFQLVSSGTINTVNGYAAPDTTSSTKYMELDVFNSEFPELADDQEFTVITVSNHNTTNDIGCNFNTSTTNGSYFGQYFDRRTVKRHTLVFGDSTLLAIDLSAQISSADTRVLTTIRNATDFKAYVGTTLDNSAAHSGKTYTNTRFIVGANQSETLDLNGDLCEIQIYASDKSTDNLTAIQTQLDTDWIP